MIELQSKANAKLNLTLDVIGTRPDGYHDLCMVMQEISLGDDVTLQLETGEPWRVISESSEIPCDDSNLAVKAARLFFEASGIDCGGLTATIRKRTPVCAGMGGGSADGAAVLRMLDAHYRHPLRHEALYAVAEATGSDVPFALFGGTALAEEKGQILTRLAPMPPCFIVLCKPSFSISTPALFRAIDGETISARPQTARMLRALEEGDLRRIASLLCNVFEPVVAKVHTEIGMIRRTMLEQGALGASMTGSGPTVFGIFEDQSLAESAFSALKPLYPDTFITAPV